MFQRILVPLDGSEGAERAIPVAARIAHASEGTIVFVRVIPPPTKVGTYAPVASVRIAVKSEAFEKDLAEAANYLTDTIAAYAGNLTGIATEMKLGFGAASPEIFSTARLEHVDLIVMCSHGETGLKRWVFGSIAQQAVRHSPVPVLVLNEHGVLLPEPDATHPLRILVALDGSALSEAALEPAARLLAAWTPPQARGELHLIRVVDVPPVYGKFRSQAYFTDSLLEEASQEAKTYMKAVADCLREESLAGPKLTITSGVSVSTDVAGTIIRLAGYAEGVEHTRGYHLIAMATHGRSGLQRLVMGSVTEQVLGATKLPLLIMRPRKTDAEPEKATEKAETGVAEQSWVGLL